MGFQLLDRTLNEEPLLRAELFSAVQMSQHGGLLARSHKLSFRGRGGDQLLSRLAENEGVIIDACALLTETIKGGNAVTPAAEWLLDNFYLIEEQIRTAKLHFPKNYSKELPRIQKEKSEARPRVYDIALENISHGDGRVDLASLSSFVYAYQQVTALTLGELWAIPIMLRLALIENLRRVAVRLSINRLNRKLALTWATKMSEAVENDPSNLILLVADMARSNPPMESSFVAELLRRLQGQSQALTLPLNWLGQKLATMGLTIDQLVQKENQQQAADQVSISNSIGSLRFLSTMVWKNFVESISIVEQILRKDEIYSKMDFTSRDIYRHAVENLAKQSGRSRPSQDANHSANQGDISEIEIAEHAIQMAQKNKTHVGFFLIDPTGLEELKKDLKRELKNKVCSNLGDSGLCFIKKFALAFYLGGAFFLSVVLAIFICFQIDFANLNGISQGLVVVLAALTASQISLALVNWLVTAMTSPRLLPRMDYLSSGIPDDSKTLVVIPTMLLSSQYVDSLAESLEVHYLANQDKNLKFALLTDFKDAPSQEMPDDQVILDYAKKNIDRLNAKYPDAFSGGSSAIFILLHRPRRWNASEQVWMGYERKRGKLCELNEFLRGRQLRGHQGVESGAEFSLVVGGSADLLKTKYVITLDSDTKMPRGAARQFVATMDHPLNRAQFTTQLEGGLQRVTKGYGILQPRVSTSVLSSQASYYEMLYGGEVGIDPYTRSTSDVYQDLFDEGSYIGKGIYNVDVFQQSLKEVLPENRILSHDLIEGCYARSGLLSDVLLYEEYPASYHADVQRRQRWLRGDWQIASWLVGQPSSRMGNSALSRWKILDNLRRSVFAPGLFVLLLIGWKTLPSSGAGVWTLSIVGLLLLPMICNLGLSAFQKPRDMLFRQHVDTVLKTFWRQGLQAILTLIFLPHEAWLNVRAIVQTLWRVCVSHKNLLEWQPSSHLQNPTTVSSNTKQMLSPLLFYLSFMRVSPLAAVVTFLLLMIENSVAVAWAVPVLALWMVSPLLAELLSRPLVYHTDPLSEEQMRFLKSLARKMWLFFEVHVGPENHWLPLDNIQEQPVAAVARRTSPTNIGLSLLANLTAYDFGFISAGRLLNRTQKTLTTMSQLERFQGHFYNWYNTENLTPLLPMYVSTVDSGNLAGHLLTLRPGLTELLDAPIISQKVFPGLLETFELLSKSLSGYERPKWNLFVETLKSACQVSSLNLSLAYDFLETLTSEAKKAHSPSSIWGRALAEQCRDFLEDIQFLMPNVWPLTQTVKEVSSSFEQIPNLRQLQQDYQTRSIHDVRGIEALRRVNERMGLIESLAGQAASLATMKYDFLFDSNNHLLAIGYNVTERRRDSSNYDLLASEARLATFVGIAQGCLPQESWFALGRQLTVAKGEPILLSWSGSMFEYLMPLLVMPTFKNTLLDQTYLSAVKRQIDYGLQRGEFWGISESGFNSFDSNLNYQYRAFGVPGLGLKRGLGEDHVIAPYAAMMALMVLPREACTNLQKIFALGHEGLFGLYEAIDYTASRLARGQTAAVVRSFMAHHQGMGLLSLSYFLLDKPLQRRFESDPLFQATMPLLYERVPKATSTYLNTTEFGADTRTDSGVDQEGRMRTFQRPDPRTPEVQLLSNGRYHVMVTSAGGGYSRWKDIAITRWQEDPTRDNWGIFCYVRDMSDLKFWSTAFQPSLASPKKYEVFFTEGRAEFRRSDGVFESYTEVVVSPEDDIELRRTCLTNRSRYTKKVEVTSYAEVVLATPSADAMHPAFSKLFVQTEIFPSGNAILCSRRPRSISEKTPWMFHLMVAHGAKIEATSYETDRMKFVGRGNSPLAPQAMRDPSPLSGTEGSVLDPIVAIRYVVTLLPEESVTLNLVVGARESRQECLALIDKCQDLHFANRVIELAWTHSQVVLRQLNATETDGQLYSRLANSIIYTNAVLRAEASILARNHRGQSGLWSSAISGDLPIVLVQIKNIENMELIRQLVQAHAYWRAKGLIVDLVIWNEDNPTYRQALQEQIMGLVSSTTGGSSINRPGGIFLRLGDQISGEDRILFQAVARVVLSDASGTLLEQINRRQVREPRRPRLITVPRKLFTADRNILDRSGTGYSVTDQELILQNELGGFTPDGKEYVVRTSGQKTTPAPWVNVMANAHFGTVVSESGQSYTWLENAHEFRLTPWLNDPVSDLGGECFYLRDEETGDYWSPTPLPVRGKTEYQSRHGFGYSIFEHFEEGIFSELTMFVALNAPVKYFALRIRNDSNLARRLSITGYIEWVMGDMRSKNAMHILTEIDPATGALVARNPYNTEFGGIQAFFSVNSRETTFTCDRGDFIGRNGSLHKPAALERISLSGLVGAGLDPCGAIQLPFELISGQEKEFVFTLGSVNSAAEVGAAAAELQAVRNYWSTTLSSVTVNTPDPAINVLCNGWLVYQVLTCRLWARSGYYQSGGAFGARDQLQDVMALVHCQPHLVREHILFAAAHQFIEGDVLHWWHPPSGRGVRTLCSDDFLWLPAAVERYVVFTGDTDILNEKAPFIEGRKVSSDEDSYYDLPTPSKEIGTLYEHCRRAIENGLKFGVHGLSLIGSGDWNDGMNKVGEKGKGESVWLSFFIYKVLQDFSKIAQTYGDSGFATRCQEQAKFLQENIEKHGWDGQWYRRAYFDDGTPLGSSENVECQIDSISQSWSVLSGAADPVRSHKAMASAKERLVRGSVVQLLDPPFDKSNLNPGYIRGYVPGVRENGGQYTHAAVWMAMAFAKMGDNTQASALLKMINPIHHTNSPGGLERYKVEPYVMAADVYSVSPHLGRGGWTWYTGSAGWMYRLILESVLGLSREGNKLRISPCLPEEWGFFEISYRYKQTTYKIVFRKNGGQGKTEAKTNADSEHLTTQVIVDGVTEIEMVNDGKSHLVEIQRKIF